jgi:hypothetical protein
MKNSLRLAVNSTPIFVPGHNHLNPELLQLLNSWLRKMRPALTLTAFYFAFALPRFPIAAQEHVDVPLPPYDPPPPASHHGETHDDQPPRVSRQTHSQSRVSPRPHSQPKARNVKSSHDHHHHRRHVRPRRHSFFHWPWQHHK